MECVGRLISTDGMLGTCRGVRHFVLRFFEAVRSIGVNHVILNFKYGARNAGDVLEEIGKRILPQLAASQP